VDADRMLLATQSALDADGDLLDAQSAPTSTPDAASLRARASQRADAAAIEAATQALAKAPRPLPPAHEPQASSRRWPASAMSNPLTTP
jgi:molecular chaperone HscA